MKGSTNGDVLSKDEIDDWLDGAIDCRHGTDHTAGRSAAYDRGYAIQYQHEQNMNELTGRKH